ncbi:uncharacterized protein LOC133298506 [Gastrolobium bilobum]|uniref:uncharacterized protein LOC133298506 n=1 Tax=Gastrolobium bilobum TaxID=150636 RepID=UPI002AAFAF48|nr:uncharacterized protein LOC133298506 [Gastrolobium bilobum]
MNILTWNCRGAVTNKFKSTFNRFRKKYGVGVAAILEPRVSGNKAVNIIRRLGFTNYIISDAKGFAGGIWILWDPLDVHISLIRKDDQFVHVWVEFPGKRGFYWTAVYASPKEDRRFFLWEDLKHLGRNMNDPWMMSGDFNEIAFASEKRGGAPVDLRRCNRFNNVLNSCGVMDLGGEGNRFTWKGPKFLHLKRIFKRLDRAVANELWRNCFDLADVVKVWNREVFGFIEHRRNRVTARLEGIQRMSNSTWHSHLEDLEGKLRKELAEILDHEEQIWFQKSRDDWIKDGDRNTRFYHTSWVTGEEDLIELARDYFQNLFKEERSMSSGFQTCSTWPVISLDQKLLLSLEITDEEIKKAFFQMPSLRAPGPDGFPALFFHKNWGLLRHQIIGCMKFYLQHPDQIREINHTLIALIPKVDRPCSMKQFRPIALCNSIYKGLSKILANKLKPLLGDLISPNQDEWKKSFFSLKIDLEKAYDKLDWRFIKSVLEDLKLPGDFTDAIMGCVTCPYFEVLWNGARTPGFYSQRGIRQGDPLSPYLFVLCMEKLTHLILDEVGNKKWLPIRAGRNGPFVSHLLFVDDIVLFAEASSSQLECITGCFEKFANMSGQSVSLEKSCIFFSKNVGQEAEELITRVSGFKKVKNVGRYLGALMRITLAKSVISAIPVYHMQNSMLPVHVCKEIEKIQRCFIWGDSEDKRRAHYVAWDQMCLPRECGGLGIINLRTQNEAFMQKIAWQLTSDQESLWAKVMGNWKLMEKYLDEATLYRLCDICPPAPVNAEDWLVWRRSCPSKSLVRNAYCQSFDLNISKDQIWSKLWKWRGPYRIAVFLWNAVVHDTSFSWPNNPVFRILCYLKEMKLTSGVDPFIVDNSVPVSALGGPAHLAEMEGIKVYVDGAVNIFSRIGACGGVICTTSGVWLGGFAFNIGSCTILEAELWAIFHGLKLAVDLQLSNVWLGSDSKEALLCCDPKAGLISSSPLVQRLLKEIHGFDQVKLEFIPRHLNCCADSLAKLGFNSREGELVFFHSPPTSILPFWNELCKEFLLEHVSVNMLKLSI